MRTLTLASVLLLVVSNLSFAAELLPKSHFHCINRQAVELQACEKGSQFYFAGGEDGRCGCVANSEVVPVTACDKMTITCNNENETFATLVVSQNMCGMMEEIPVGCGCFSTFRGVVPF